MARTDSFAASNSLAAKLIQLTMPGVPDVYQGTEFWDRSLTDPDNRRPVDFTRREEELARLDGGLLPDPGTEASKLLVTSRALRLRRDRPALLPATALSWLPGRRRDTFSPLTGAGR